jgi:metal-responsive CopG/Arc/MetJ family transcriptional regulator
MHSRDPEKELHRQVNIRLNSSLFKEISELADRVTSSVSQIVREAIINYLNERRKKL